MAGTVTIGPVVAPERYVIMPPAQAGGVLSLNAQHPHICQTIRAAFPRLEANLAFIHAFPDALERGRSVAKAMFDAAGELGFLGLQMRFSQDNVFTRSLASIPNQRISTSRGAIKKIADAHVTAYYALGREDCKERVAWLLKHLTYIYPAEPYQHTSIVATLRACFFGGAHSFAAKHVSQFTSTLANRPDEREVPLVMLALVGTALHAALTEWRLGFQKALAFSGDSFLDAYNEHVLLLQDIKAKNPRAYHVMMHRLYQRAR
ncbi:hypothetical protein OH77DRAFT_1415399 [Trametes cingulata]|nr:hypothetical protein OH77DRAFT_1415399 [Trametes cingulata]